MPTTADALYIGERQRARILRRTESGRDVNGAAFSPYSTSRLYWSPNGRLSGRAMAKLGAKKNSEAVRRFAKKIGVKKSGGSGAPYVSSTGQTICFPGGYAQFKKQLGRSKVDLRGAQAPHMLQAIQVKVEGGTGTVAAVKLGIYGPKARIANAHTSGGRVPKRTFFGISRGDTRDAVRDLRDRIKVRLKDAGS